MRTQKLIQPGLQLRQILWTVTAGGLGLALQFLLFTNVVASQIFEMTGDPATDIDAFHSALQTTLFASLGLVLPTILGVGLLSTFRVAGPLYRMTRFLEAVERGQQSAECRIRKGDELHEFCDLLNRVTEPLRASVEEDQESERKAA